MAGLTPCLSICSSRGARSGNPHKLAVRIVMNGMTHVTIFSFGDFMLLPIRRKNSPNPAVGNRTVVAGVAHIADAGIGAGQACFVSPFGPNHFACGVVRNVAIATDVGIRTLALIIHIVIGMKHPCPSPSGQERGQENEQPEYFCLLLHIVSHNTCLTVCAPAGRQI